MGSPVPHRIRDIQRKAPERRTPDERRRLEAWGRRDARMRLAGLEHALQEMGVAMLALPGSEPAPYHDPRRPVFSRECRAGRPAECRWYPCCNDAHPDPREAYAELRQRLATPASFDRAS